MFLFILRSFIGEESRYLVMKRVKSKAMFPPSWKFEGKPNSIPPQFFVLFFRVFLGGLHFLGGLRFLGLRSLVCDLRFLDTPGQSHFTK